jgi:hypothetical protein
VYDLYSIYKGLHSEKFNYWKNANIDILTPLQKCDRMFAIPFENTDVFKNRDSYMLHYISRCARLLQLYPKTSIVVPPPFCNYIKQFQFDQIPFDENRGYWANEVIGFLPGPHELGMEDIDALRALYPAYINEVTNEVTNQTTKKICAIVIGTTITEDFAEKLADFIRKLDFDVRFVYDEYEPLFGASICIVMDNWHKLWALPKGCHVIEFQRELKMDGECQHLTHVAGFTSCLLFLAKGSVEDVHEQMIEQLQIPNIFLPQV